MAAEANSSYAGPVRVAHNGHTGDLVSFTFITCATLLEAYNLPGNTCGEKLEQRVQCLPQARAPVPTPRNTVPTGWSAWPPIRAPASQGPCARQDLDPPSQDSQALGNENCRFRSTGRKGKGCFQAGASHNFYALMEAWQAVLGE